MRTYCEQCQYPASRCLCAAISTQTLSANVVILQHPRERRHAKNTAHIARLCSAQISIVATDNAEAMTALRDTLSQTPTTALVYPTQHSRPIERCTALKHEYRQWLFLDGSWKQAYAILQQHTFLQTLPSFHFATPPESCYQIRHTRVANSLSTLESIAYCMQYVYDDDTRALLRGQQALVERWQGPLSHRR